MTTQWTDKHYDFTYALTEKDVKNGSIKIDPYFVAKQWRVGSKDDSGALWHCLKTIARFGDKNEVEREVKALYAQVKGLARSFDVELDDSTGKSEGMVMNGQKDLPTPPPMDNEYYNQDCWYPDNSGEWIEYDGSGQPVADNVAVEVLLQYERDMKCWPKPPSKAWKFEWDWGNVIDDAKIVAYRVVK